MKDRLEEYYNNEFRQEGMPEFKDIKEEDKPLIRNNLSFSLYNINCAFSDLWESIKRSFKI